jgi:hypothetical protein
MKKQHTLYASAGLILANSSLWFAPLSARASTTTFTPSLRPVVTAVRSVPLAAPRRALVVVPKAEAPVTGNSGVLDRRHQFALGMLETGNDDREIGGAGEVSRYQIMPSVWRRYSASRNFGNPQVSLAVAQRHWATLYGAFKQQAGREPTDFDMYVLWNTHYGYYAARNFNPARLAPVVRDRAQRYVNLVQCGDTDA